MVKDLKGIAFLLLFFCVMVVTHLYSQSVEITGFVYDSNTKKPLPGANAYLKGTVFGSATITDGWFQIMNIPPGKYTLVISYIGYEDYKIDIDASREKKFEYKIFLEPRTIKGESIVITAQARGQKSAINQQLVAKSIKNIVSSEQIQELPDANAAESLRRLPGVSITRKGGEGNQVVIRGLEPKFNIVTIDGIRMASSNPANRSVELDMISSTILEGIEISKTITADQDPDMLGGSVDFKIREARKEGMNLNLLLQGGYMGLFNAENKFRNYKLTPNFESRMLNDRLGIFIQGNIERRNLTSNQFNAEYDNKGDTKTDYVTNALYLHKIPRDKKRYNGVVVLDYYLRSGMKIKFSNFLSSGVTDELDRNEILNIRTGPGLSNQHIYNFDYKKSKINLFHNIFEFNYNTVIFNSSIKLAHSLSETDNPNNWIVSFYQSPANLSQFEQMANLDPRDVNNAVLKDAEKTVLHTIQVSDNYSKERDLLAKLDFKNTFFISNNVSCEIKYGGKFKESKRYYNSDVYSTNASLTSPSARAGAILIANYFNWDGDPNSIPMNLFVDSNYQYGKMFSGDFQMHNPLNYNSMRRLVQLVLDSIDYFNENAPEGFAKNAYLSRTNDYDGNETLSAVYFMATLKIGEFMEMIPGVRYQELKTSYTGVRGQQTTFPWIYNPYDTTIKRIYSKVLPNLNLKIKPNKWFDIRSAYSNTLSYPDYISIIPRIDATQTPLVVWNNVDLKPTESKNIDLYFTMSNNKVGLFTVGGFYKNIKNVIYPWTFYMPGSQAQPYYLPEKKPNPRWIYQINTYVNNPFKADLWGIELEWQTHFWYLPSILKGLVLNVNYTHIYSKAKYPYQKPGAIGVTKVDTFYTDRLIYQPDNIINLTIGYDYKGLSIRASYQYQNDVFFITSVWPQLRGNSAAYSRWDLAIKQKLPIKNVELYINANNINYSKDKIVLQKYTNIPVSIEEYGMMIESGLRLRF